MRLVILILSCGLVVTGIAIGAAPGQEEPVVEVYKSPT
jgi:hypothetical protein